MRLVSVLLLVIVMAPLASRAQAPADAREFQVDSDASWLRVLAYPDGPLRRFGHHHVISHQVISGVVEVPRNPLESNIRLEIAVADFVVDDPDLRALEGEEFEGEISEKDIAGTRGNMLGDRLLHGEQFPSISVRSTRIDGTLPDVTITATVTLKDLEHTVAFPARIELTDDSFVATGQLDLTHGDLGLTPFTAAGGALSVRDLMVFKYEIAGHAVQ